MHTVDLQPIYTILNEALLTLLTGLAGWAAAAAIAWVKAHVKFLSEATDQKLAEGLNRALSNGVQIAMQQVDKIEAEHPSMDTKSVITAWAANYAIGHSPQAMARWGLSPNELATKALAYLPTPAITDDTTGITIPAPAAVQVTNLQPVKG